MVSIFLYSVWPLNLEINRGHLLLKMYQCTKFDVYQAKNYQDTEQSVLSYVQFDLETHWGNVLVFFKVYQWLSNVQRLMFIKERVFKILSSQYIPMSSLTFDLKINRVHLLLRMYLCIKFEVCQAKGSQDIEWSIYSHVKFDRWPFDLKINRVHILLKMYQCIKFEFCQAKSSQDIEWTKYPHFQY
jgi:polyhydroxyalkanoate synthesis regulator protein